MRPYVAPPTYSGSQTSAYRLPHRLVLAVLWSIVRGRQRDIAVDTVRLLAPPRPAPQVEGAESIPAQGPFLVVTNHYARPGLKAWWPAILLTWAIGRVRPDSPPRWLMVSEWTWPTWQYRYFVTPFTRRLFTGMAHTYSLILTPPVLNHDYGVQQGAVAVRRFLSIAREAGQRSQVLAIAPEGREGPEGTLVSLAPGTGRFLLYLSKHLPILPAAVHEQPAGVLMLRFGSAFGLAPPAGLPKERLDAWVAQETMGRVARLLPEGLRGEYVGSGPGSS